MPDVNITDLTPNLGNSSMAIPGLKHHQLSVLDTLPAASKYQDITTDNEKDIYNYNIVEMY